MASLIIDTVIYWRFKWLFKRTSVMSCIKIDSHVSISFTWWIRVHLLRFFHYLRSKGLLMLLVLDSKVLLDILCWKVLGIWCSTHRTISSYLCFGSFHIELSYRWYCLVEWIWILNVRCLLLSCFIANLIQSRRLVCDIFCILNLHVVCHIFGDSN